MFDVVNLTFLFPADVEDLDKRESDRFLLIWVTNVRVYFYEV